MSNGIIYYAVIALTRDQIDEVVSSLKGKENTDALISWLRGNKETIYGDLPEDWRPFGESTIKEMIEQNSGIYHSETHEIANLDQDCNNVEDISYIKVFFIDIFSMYIEKYRKLATRSDLAFCRAQDNNCCFLINCKLPPNVQDQLETICKKFWPSVSRRYNDGCLHRMAARIDDLNNFKNYLKIKAEQIDKPNSKSEIKVAAKLNRYEEGPRPF